MPVELPVTRTNGRAECIHSPVFVWLHGARTHVLRVPRSPETTRAEIGPDGLFPGIDRSNGVW